MTLSAVAAAQGPTTRPAGEDQSSRLLGNSPPRVIQPRWSKDAPPSAAKGAGGLVVEARARIVKVPSTNWFAVRYEAEGNLAPAPQLLLPCELLEQVEAYSPSGPPPVLKVSGETTWYRRRSFLLLREVITDPGAGAAATTKASPTPAPASATGAAATSGPASAPAPGGGADPASILQRLAEDRPGMSLGARSVELEPPQEVPSVAPAPESNGLASPVGTMVVDRVVRIYPEEKSSWWAARFLGDNTLREPPLRLLPCPQLEEAEDLVRATARHLQFRISGEMTQYKGRQYLLLRKLMVERDLGQL